MKETAKEFGKQLLEILRLILFIPTGFLAGTIVKFPLFLIARLQESMFGLKMESWGTHLWQTLIFYLVCFLASIYVKPKFLKLNPWGTVPFLRYKNQTICESIAICKFLESKKTTPKLFGKNYAAKLSSMRILNFAAFFNNLTTSFLPTALFA